MSVTRQAGKVWIEGVPALIEPGHPVPWLARSSQTCTFAGTLEAALSLTERPYSYEQILAFSGMAFRTRWFDGENGPTGCPCAPVGETPDVKRRFPAATSWHFDEYAADGWDKPPMQAARQAVVRSIDAGRPVLVIDRHLNSVVAYGYAESGEVLLIKTLVDGDYACPLSELGQSPSLVHILRGPDKPPPFPQVFRDVVSDAVERWHIIKSEFIPDRLKNGRAALQAWIRGLEQHEALATKVDPGKLLFYHLWAYKHLWDARRAAASFLSKHAALFPARRRHSLRQPTAIARKRTSLARPMTTRVPTLARLRISVPSSAVPAMRTPMPPCGRPECAAENDRYGSNASISSTKPSKRCTGRCPRWHRKHRETGWTTMH